MPHLNNKQKKNTNPSSADRIITSLSSAHQRKNKTKLKKKLAQISPYFEAYTNPFVKLAQTTGPTLGGQKPKRRKNSIQPWSLGKGDIKHNKLKKKMKTQRNTAWMKEQTINTEVQINEEEIGKLPEKEFRIMIVKMIKKKPWKQNGENARIN